MMLAGLLIAVGARVRAAAEPQPATS